MNFASSLTVGGTAWFGIRPEHIQCGDDAASCPIKLESKVQLVEPLGSDTLARVLVGDHQIWVRLDGQAELKAGDPLAIGFSAALANIFDSTTEERL